VRILEYSGLTTGRVAGPYRRAVEAIARGDFRTADVKKLSNLSHGKFYRARLDGPHRLLFALVRYRGEVCALMLEVIENHDYASSRFLRGSTVDETKIVDAQFDAAAAEAEHIRYLHPARTTLRFLDKPLSFDDAQDAVYRSPPPLVIVGGAGSGKTALTLEKLKDVPGEVLYVTQSAYLARNARDLYYAAGFERSDQEATFVSYREFLESIRVPHGREAGSREFTGWFARQRQGHAFKNIDSHQAFEEIRGVILARAGGVLTRADYLGLGVRQSIFPAAERERVYDLFERYREWLAAANLYDPGLVAHEWLALAAPRYDFVVIDEVQDLTMAQLAVALRTLKAPDRFLLCGDSNQIVHPNFFSWSQVKTLFWRDAQLADRQELRVLRANFRNAPETTRVANALLKIKHRRFGSIDRESNFLVDAVGEEPGSVQLLADQPATKRELDARIRQSTRFAVLVMRDEDKAAAREHFATPLLFSIHEAKGLEYDSIVLYRFVSDYRRDFAEIAEGVTRADLDGDTLEYRRARDKSDKSLEIYKFFVNALYVALTRAVKNLYWIESDTEHPLLRLLDLAADAAQQPRVDAQRSSVEDWQKEARKLELQGKQEQADAIRQSILKQVAPPWPVVGEAAVRELLAKVFRERAVGDKHKRRLAEYAAFHDEPELAAHLAEEAGFGVKQNFEQQAISHRRRLLTPYAARNFKEVLRQCGVHGLEHRTAMNQTPLIAAAAAGNVALVAALVERGADVNATDHYGCNALHAVLREAFRDPRFAQGPAAALYELLAPAHVDLKSGERLVRIDKRLSEYFVFQTFWTLFRTRFTRIDRTLHCALDTRAILAAWRHLPEAILRASRNKRQHLSHVLSRNEVARDYAYNRALFRRVAHGWYQLNGALEVRTATSAGEGWQPILEALNLRLVAEFSTLYAQESISALFASAGLPACGAPIMLEPALRRVEDERRRREELARREKAERSRGARERAAQLAQWERHRAEEAARLAEKPRWGTPEARRAARRELQERIEQSHREGEKDDSGRPA